ncbi:Dipeptide transport system permease protein DppB [[Clostridium] cellulosi]|uniref:Dipeptide transport system permease protein DppB n=1 Tax=[Clostridium] cellulosi TaxID=29343 RepID=A0A078KPL1_9FIRM|nr:Dipeptide transport system permease protein DppB [[Clostridium] cellulosi]
MRYVLKRLGLSILTLFFIITATFFLMHLVPGGPFQSDRNLPQNIIHNMEVKYGYDKPLLTQYRNYLVDILHGDLGYSVKQHGRSVNEMIGTYFPVSARLGLVAIAFAFVLGTIMGIGSALKNGKALDHGIMILATIGTSVPSFVIATVSMIIFGVQLKWLPTYGLDTPQKYILPAFALSFFPLSFIARLMRSSMLDVINQDYIKTARAKGLSESVVIIKHAARNALQPVITYLGTLTAGVLTGSFVIEKVFTIPGLGKSFVESIFNRDYPLIMGTTVFYAALLILIYFLVDVLYAVIDPRIKFGK